MIVLCTIIYHHPSLPKLFLILLKFYVAIERQHTHTHVHTHTVHMQTYIDTCMCTRMYVHTHRHAHTCVCIHVAYIHTYTHTETCTQTCTQSRTHTHTHTQKRKACQCCCYMATPTQTSWDACNTSRSKLIFVQPHAVLLPLHHIHSSTFLITGSEQITCTNVYFIGFLFSLPAGELAMYLALAV